MADTTTNFDLRYPQGPDPAAVAQDIQNLAADVDDQLSRGIRTAGKAAIATEQQTTSTSYTLLGTPDRVQGIVLPSDGLIFIAYRALIKSTGSIAGNFAQLFLGSTEVATVLPGYPTPADQAQNIGDATSKYVPLITAPTAVSGLAVGASGASDTGVGANGLRWATPDGGWGVIAIEPPAGTYEVSIRFKTSGTLYAKNRVLRVWSQSFDGLPG